VGYILSIYPFTTGVPIRQILKSAGGNNIGAALRQGKGMLVGSKRTAPKVLLALLDSKATDDVSLLAKELKDAGIGTVAIGGNKADQAQLNTIAGKPENVVTAPSYTELPSALAPVVGKVNQSKLSQALWLF
jgi:hypothetical protein